MISKAITYLVSDRANTPALNREITQMQANIRGLQNVIKDAYAQINEMSEELSSLYAPRRE